MHSQEKHLINAYGIIIIAIISPCDTGDLMMA